jgi:photosystem II stability/assembly factor-like uncharacterized protein
VKKNIVPSASGRPVSIISLDNYSLSIDPEDSKALYYGSVENGLFYTYDGAETWQLAKSLGKITIRAVAVDPDNKCLLYASSGNKLWKSNDCSRSWKQVYYDNDLSLVINTVNIDFKKNEVIYLGTSRGDIIKSSDYGENWQALYRFPGAVVKVAISPHDNKVIFAATSRQGIFRTVNAGVDWVELKEQLKEFDSARYFKDMALPATTKELIYMVSNYGMLKSTDNGDSWKMIELLTPNEEATINSLAINPKNDQELYYVTNTTFYRSLDGGKSWNTKKLPTARAGWRLIIDQAAPSTIYLTAKTIKK